MPHERQKLLRFRLHSVLHHVSSAFSGGQNIQEISVEGFAFLLLWRSSSKTQVHRRFPPRMKTRRITSVVHKLLRYKTMNY